MMRTSTPLVSTEWAVPFRTKLPFFCLVVLTSTLPQWRSLQKTVEGDKVPVTRQQQNHPSQQHWSFVLNAECFTPAVAEGGTFELIMHRLTCVCLNESFKVFVVAQVIGSL